MKDFLNYYQSELLSLRKKGGAFAKKYPEIAEYIDIKEGQSTDPQTERLIEAMAFMSAKLHKRIDDNASNIAFHILNAINPNLVNPLPPCSVVSFNSASGKSAVPLLYLERGTRLSSLSKEKVLCSFKTLYPLTIYSLSISNISLEKQPSYIADDDLICLNMDLTTNSIPVETIGITTLMFHINSNIIEDALIIYESIFATSKHAAFIKINDKIIKLPAGSLKPCGFDDEDTVCPVGKYATNTFQLFQEALHFKKKFMFFTIENVGEAIKNSGFTDIHDFSIIIDVEFINDKLFQVVKKDSLKLNCVPIVNLFQSTSDPFRFTGDKPKYLLLADQLRDKEMEIHSISEIHIIDSETSKDSVVQPYFSLYVDSDNNVEHSLFWLHTREPSDIRGLPGNDIYLSFIDTDINPFASYDDVIYAKLLCTNRFETRDIPVFARIEIEGVETGGMFGELLYKTTQSVNFANEQTNLWVLVSLLSSIHVSISEQNRLVDSLRSLLKIFSAGIPLRAEELTEQISRVSSEHIVKRFGEDGWRGFVRGVKYDFFLKEDNKSYFAFFLCSVINQYLSSSTSLNSFVQLNLLSDTTQKNIANWPSTSGRKNLV